MKQDIVIYEAILDLLKRIRLYIDDITYIYIDEILFEEKLDKYKNVSYERIKNLLLKETYIKFYIGLDSKYIYSLQLKEFNKPTIFINAPLDYGSYKMYDLEMNKTVIEVDLDNMFKVMYD